MLAGAGDGATVGDDPRWAGRAFGWAFAATFLTSIPARLFFLSGLGAEWSDVRFTPGDLSGTSLRVGAVFEVLLIVSNLATAALLYPVARRLTGTLAVGYVTARVIESTFIAVGLVAILAITDVGDALAGVQGDAAAALVAQGDTLVDIYERSFLLGPGLVVGFGNGLVLGALMYRTGLVPRGLALLGLVGGPLLVLSFVLILFDVYDNGEGPAALLALPEIAWEASLAIYTAWKGFRPVPVAEPVPPAPAPAPTAL